MATTTPDNIWTPDAGDDYAFTVDLARTADDIQDALQRRSATVGSDAERNAIFPTPVKGNRVWRSDLGYETVYLSTGVSAVGWYPSVNRSFIARRSGTQSLSTGWSVVSTHGQLRNDGLGTLFSGAAFTVVAPGTYEITAGVHLSSSSSPMAVQITKNTTSPDTAGTIASSNVTNGTAQVVSTVETLVAGDAIRVLVYSSLSNSIQSTGTYGSQLCIV